MASPTIITRAGVLAGRLAWAPRLAGRGEGSSSAAKSMLRLSPAPCATWRAIGWRAVSATNGKTSTTRLFATAVRAVGFGGDVETGANMTDGCCRRWSMVTATGQAVLEVDEAYLPKLLRRPAPPHWC